jgi:hypothetical protein
MKPNIRSLYRRAARLVAASCALVLVVAVLAGCTQNFASLNTDPVRPDDNSFNPEYLLTGTQLAYTGSSDFSYETWRVNLIYCSTMMQHFSHVAGYWVGDKYLLNATYSAAYFERAYDEQIRLVQSLVEQSKTKTQYANLAQTARIMRVLLFHRLTDIYGDVPYTEGGRGYYGGSFTPKYDQQSAIYADMLKELEEAAKALDPAQPVPNGDLFYGKLSGAARVAAWKKFAYSLMVRLGMRLTKVDAAAAKTWVEKAAAAGVMQSPSDNAFVTHDLAGDRATVNRTSQIMNLPYELPYIRLSKTFVDWLKAGNDPRLTVLAERAGDGSTKSDDLSGMPNGFDLTGGATDISKAPGYPGSLDKYARPHNKNLARLDGPTFILTSAEVKLLLAEAAVRGWSVGKSAEAWYKEGVTDAMLYLQQYGAGAVIPQASVDGYMQSNPFKNAGSIDDKLEQINTQFWAATLLNEYESWANWRRSGYPKLVTVNYPGNATNGQIPRRMRYPVQEASANAANYSEAVGRVQGGDVLTGRVWWDK